MILLECPFMGTMMISNETLNLFSINFFSDGTHF